MKTILTLFLSLFCLFVHSQDIEKQKPSDLKISDENCTTVTAITNHGTFQYHLNNTGEVEVSDALQAIFNELSDLKDVSATISFHPGVYYI